MKIFNDNCLGQGNCILISCFIFLFSTSSLFSQSPSETEYRYEIPKGQKIYSENSLSQNGLSPYIKEYFIISDLGKTKVIESGDFVFKEYKEDGIEKRDTLWFAVTEFRILNGDTLKISQKLELTKQNNYTIEANLIFKGNRIYIEQSPKHNDSFFAKLKKEKHAVHPTDKELYFKIEEGEDFEYVSKKGGISLITIPFRARDNSKDGESSFLADAKLNNVEFFVGVRIDNHTYKNGKKKKTSFNIGGFVGPGAVALNANNSNLSEGVERSVLGLNYGLGVLGAVKRVNLGIAVGVESINNNEELEWTLNNKLFFGFVCGYSLN